MSTLSKDAFVTACEAVFWIATGAAKTLEQLHAEAWKIFNSKAQGTPAAMPEGPKPETVAEAIRDLLRAHCDGQITLKGQDGAEPIRDVPRDVAAGRVDFNPFANCILAPDAPIKLWQNIRVRTTEVETQFRKRAADALRGKQDADATAYRCERWLGELMADGQPKKYGKAIYRSDAKCKFGVGPRAFDVAWDRAVEASGNRAWSKAGAPKKSKRGIETPPES